MLQAQLMDPMVLILIGAAVFSALLQEWAEACVIFSIVVLNTLIGIDNIRPYSWQLFLTGMHPFLAIHILWVNLATATLPTLALG